MEKEITLESTYGEVLDDPRLKGFTDYFYYGFGPEFRERKMKECCPGLWPNRETVEAINFYAELNKNGLLSIHYPLKGNDSNIIEMKQERKSPVAIVTAGGGYTSVANGVEAMPVTKRLYELGFTVFLFTYHVNERAIEGIDDLARAVKYVFANAEELNVLPENYIICGFSAAGHLMSQFGTDNHGYRKYGIPKPGMIVLGYPVISMIVGTTHGGSLRALLGDHSTEEQRKEYSSDLHVDDDYPPVFLWQNERDSEVPFLNSVLFEKELEKHHVPHVYEHFDSDAHGWGIATGQLADGWVDRMVSFYHSIYGL